MNGFIKKIRTNNKRKIKICLFFVLFLFTFQMAMPKLSVEADVASDDKSTVTTKASNLTLTKKAEQVGENDYKITLKVDGESETPPQVDIALMVDLSISMGDKLKDVQSAIGNFCDKLAAQKNRLDVKMALGTFSSQQNSQWGVVDPEERDVTDSLSYDYSSRKFKYYNNIWIGDNEKDSEDITQGFTELQIIKNKIYDKNVIKQKMLTNTQAGIWRLGQMLNKSNPTHKKYAILFTDGIPSLATGMNCKGLYHLEKYRTAAKNEYKNLVPKVNKFYSAGIFTNTSAEDVKIGKQFLGEIQNIVDSETYKKQYFSELASSANVIFNEICNNIIEDSKRVIARNAVITDKLDGHFVMPTKENLQVTGINKDKVMVNADGSISFNVGDIVEPGAEVSFIVSGKDPYYCATDLPTNEKATITYKNPKTSETMTSEFGIPKIDIEPKVGKLCLEKVIDKTIDADDDFAIVIQGDNGKYIANLAQNQSNTTDFYLRNKETDISNHSDFSKGFVIAGEYSATEIVPMNYKKVGMEISFDEGKSFRKLSEGEKFTIDYNQPNIYIKVTNEISNTNYWWDKEKKNNYLSYRSFDNPRP